MRGAFEAVSTPAKASRLRRSGLLLFALLATLALGEAALRALAPFPLDPPLYPGDVEPDAQLRGSTRIDAALGWRFEPHARVSDKGPDFELEYECDADGFRATPRVSGATQRIVFVGDSFTFGVGVPASETFVERTAGALERVEVHNLGMAGYGVDQMLCALREVGFAREPTAVLAVFVLDDFTRSTTSYRYRNGWMRKPTFALDADALVERTAENSPGAAWRWMSRNLAWAELARRVERRIELSWGVGERLALNARLLIEMRELCRARGIEFAAVHLPQRGAWRAFEPLAKRLERADVELLDLGAQAVAAPAELYFRRDPHLNAAGHAWVAERLVEFASARGWAARRR